MIKNRIVELKEIFKSKNPKVSTYSKKYYEEFLKQDDRANKIVRQLHEKARKKNKNNILVAIREDASLQSYQKELEDRYHHFLEAKEKSK
ncbi:hypothetical protein [Natranaerofaba carboxydovora]|uniref:hypothetical protein n=1 Tax=Natranaerofaba carboxydovora TaxID=2742683 RepID=UPI001F133FAB|nr:hypothetical protein [Natranaerofaba carboxydovora]UMZ73866.1 hypothetical protein ACONDI_01436 [Natranaerofaba carboxydovora]